MIKLLLLILSLPISQPPILPPLKNTSEPVIPPLELNINLSSNDFICVSFTAKPPIDADTNLAYPAVVISANTSPLVGTSIELAEKVPWTSTSPVILPPVINTFDAVKLPNALTWNLDADIKLFCLPPCVGIPAADPDM